MMCKNEACEGAAEDAALAIDGEMGSRGAASFLLCEQRRELVETSLAMTHARAPDMHLVVGEHMLA